MARTAGALYLMLIAAGFFYLKYVPSALIDWDDPTATVSNITTSETLFRMGILVGLLGYILFLVLPLVLYKLLSPVNQTHAVLMVALSAISVPLSFANMIHNFDVLTLISDGTYLKVFGPDKLQSQVILHLESYSSGNMIASIFWGLWLFPFGYLVFRSGFLPKIIGVLLMIGCFGYVLNFACHLLLPHTYSKTIIGKLITIPGSLGELSVCLWLLIAGVKDKKLV
ncbi:DUF4386 domain-containing protein [Mucilaginibacter sp. PPCGB 2223]|uniref:DUF4386 domain-containing protein n=1 Tax=Mucilaginibacter sp. PPCGB 2223 TaxID=1886027 RepID=UPI0020C806FC|nr:DUF4386 domain-containing protein [Mucilaginibacter sp. PPCGB 2223]